MIDTKENNGFLKLSNVLENLRDCGVEYSIKFPRIVLLGNASSGKTSLLESIVGLNLFPIGQYLPTQRPLELKLGHIEEGEPWAMFDERKGQKFTDFNQIKEIIQQMNEEVPQRRIDTKPIVLHLFSQAYPELTIVDLPGMTRIPTGYAPFNNEEVCHSLVMKYCDHPNTLIICVCAAPSDIATCHALRKAKEVDSNFNRTVGVLTKIDLMDRGTDCRKGLMGQEVGLKLGFVGVKNRSQKDVNEGLSLQQAYANEKAFFANDPIYRKMNKKYYGIDSLMHKLIEVICGFIERRFSNLNQVIFDSIRNCEEELSLIGVPIPIEEEDKLSLILKMMRDYCELFDGVLKGRQVTLSFLSMKNEGRDKINAMFKSFLEQFTKYNPTEQYSDEIINALEIEEGGSFPHLPSVDDAFYQFLKPELEKMREPINKSLENIYQYLIRLSSEILSRTFIRFPQAGKAIEALANQFLSKEKEKAKHFIDSIVDSEINYLYTNDSNCTTHFQSNLYKAQTPSSVIQEKRKRIDAFFKLIVNNLRESIAKAISFFLLRPIQNDMPFRLYDLLHKNKRVLSFLIEREEASKQRIELNRRIKVIKEVRSVIRSDLDLMSLMKINIEESSIEETEQESLEDKVTPSLFKAQERIPQVKQRLDNLFGTNKS